MDRVHEERLTNGLKVILLENHRAPVVTFQIWYRVGSRNEPWGKTGISHVLEHMMFKGTEKVRGREFTRLIQENGGNSNAFTSQDYTAYFENLRADRIHVPLRLESDRMRNLVLKDSDFQNERMVVMEERRLRTEDRPQAFLMEQLNAAAFQVQPYHWPIIGWMEDLARLTLSDLEAYYRSYYTPNNAFVVAVGDFDTSELFVKIEEAFGPIEKREVFDRTWSDPPQRGERRVIVKREAGLPFLAMGYHVPNLRERDSYVLEVIAALLSEGKSARLYRSLVLEQQLALDVETRHPLLSHDPGLFMIAAQPLPGKDPAQVESALDQELKRIQNETVGQYELEKAKNQLEADFIAGQDSLFFQAMVLARHEIASSWRAVDDYVAAARSVSPEDILRVASRYLVVDNRTVGILEPLRPEEAPDVRPKFSIKSRTIQ